VRRPLRSPKVNSWLPKRRLVLIDETSSEERWEADYLKHIITANDLMIELKYINSYPIENTAAFFFTTNHPNALLLENKERR
jgi:phage/plasmid-associated DNA primase